MVRAEVLRRHARRISDQKLSTVFELARWRPVCRRPRLCGDPLSFVKRIRYARLGVLQPTRPWWSPKSAHVMYHGTITGTNLAGRDPGIVFKVRRNYDVHVIEDPLGWHGVSLGRLKHHVRLEVPAASPFHASGFVFRIALRRVGIGPRNQGLNLSVRQPPVVQEVSIFWVGEPGRHLSGQHRGLDRPSPGTRSLIGEERSPAGFPRTMTHLAPSLQNRKHVAVARNSAGCGLSRACHEWHQSE